MSVLKKYEGKKVYHLKNFLKLWESNNYVLIFIQFDNKNFFKSEDINGNRVVLKTSFLNVLLQKSGLCFSGTVSCYFLKNDFSLLKIIKNIENEGSLNLCMTVVCHRLRMVELEGIKNYFKMSVENTALNLATFRYCLLVLLYQKILLLRSIKRIISREGV